LEASLAFFSASLRRRSASLIFCRVRSSRS
jgi:hypothetical protein